MSLDFPFCSSSIISDISLSLQSSRNIEESEGLDKYEVKDGKSVIGILLYASLFRLVAIVAKLESIY